MNVHDYKFSLYALITISVVFFRGYGLKESIFHFQVDHLFKHRINSSIVHASDYLKQFPSPILTIVAKFISFVSGGFAAVLIIIAFLEESLLEGHVIILSTLTLLFLF